MKIVIERLFWTTSTNPTASGWGTQKEYSNTWATRPLWHVRCYDHNCRTSESVLTKIEYCHKNPVTRGLVDSPEGWRWSSYNWYQGRKDVPLEMDTLEV